MGRMQNEEEESKICLNSSDNTEFHERESERSYIAGKVGSNFLAGENRISCAEVFRSDEESRSILFDQRKNMY